MNQTEKAKRFAALHVKGDPVILYNIWDAGGARAIAAAGAKAVATGSWSVAAAHGYEDGEAIPLDFVERILARVVASTELPVTVDFEGGYAAAPGDVANNVARVLGIGAVGINFEDGRPGGSGLYDAAKQCARIAAIRERADEAGMPLFINARTDLFLQAPAERHGERLAEAKERAKAYLDAGAGGIFVPGLADEKLVAEFCEACPAPANIMMMSGVPSIARLAELGVGRVSFGPMPYLSLMQTLRTEAQAAMQAPPSA